MGFKKIGFVEFSLDNFNPVIKMQLSALSNEMLQLDSLSEISNSIKDIDCLLVGLSASLSARTIDEFPNLKYIGLLATGYDKIDIQHAKKRNIVVTNVPGYSTNAVAEFVIGALLEHYRGLSLARTMSKQGNFGDIPFTGNEITNKKFGIVGLGQIGQKTAKIAKGFESQVIYWSRKRKPEYEKNGIRYEELDTVLQECDIISIHLEANSETDGIIDAARIRKIKKGTVIINTCSISLLDFDSLKERLANNEIVYITMGGRTKPELLSQLAEYPNCIIYPAITYKTNESLNERQRIFIENITKFLDGKPQNVVNQ